MSTAEPKPSPETTEATRSPFRFGLRALLAVMAVCGVQFALMSYIGILWGLLVGLAACFVALALLVFTAMIFWRGSGTPFMHQLDRLAIRLVLAIVVVAIGTFFAGGGEAIYKQVMLWRDASAIQKELGFTAHFQWYRHHNRTHDGLMIDSIALGGPFDLAGAEPNDVIICDQGLGRFYEMINDNRGRTVNITVAAGADMQPLEKCVSRSIEVTIPN